MMTFVPPETPEEIAHQEDWINHTLSADYPGVTVCLHADTTVSYSEGMARRECDYCPASVTAPGYGAFPAMAPWYFTPVG